ncbi:MAG: polysaccharide deacetylase family protein [Acidimicrobiia bacterium]
MGKASASLKRATIVHDRLRPAAAGITILIYHRVGARTPVSVDLPTSLFDEQMAFLAERCRPVSLTDAAELLEAGEAPADDRPHVVVTFDDGTADFVDEALPVLERHGVPATYYLATDFIDRQLPFPDDGVALTWDAAKEIVASGLVDIGSHTHTHALLDRIPAGDAAHELDRSIAMVESHLGVTPIHFAYPKALLGSPQNEHEVRKRFRTATIGRTRPNPWTGSDLHRLTRSPIQTSDGMEFFERKVRGGMRLENDVRDLVNRWRYRDAVR